MIYSPWFLWFRFQLDLRHQEVPSRTFKRLNLINIGPRQVRTAHHFNLQKSNLKWKHISKWWLLHSILVFKEVLQLTKDLVLFIYLFLINKSFIGFKSDSLTQTEPWIILNISAEVTWVLIWPNYGYVRLFAKSPVKLTVCFKKISLLSADVQFDYRRV